MRPISLVSVLMVIVFCASQVNAEEAHKKPAKTAKAADTQKHLTEAGKTKKVVKALPEKVEAAFHKDHHFGQDGIKAIYSIGNDLWWVEVTDDGKDYLLEFNNDGQLQAIAFEKPNGGGLVVLIEGDDGYVWAVDDEGNAVAFQP
jgi:hypothetical protein